MQNLFFKQIIIVAFLTDQLQYLIQQKKVIRGNSYI